MSDPLIRAERVSKHYSTSEGFVDQLFGLGDEIRAVDGVDLEVQENEILGLVGESGCGKTTLGKTLIGLEDATSGKVMFKGTDITELSDKKLRPYRSDLQMIFQDPGSSLNPRRTVGSILSRPLKLHTDLDKEERQNRIAEILERVNLSPEHVSRYPSQFSGGQQQRVGIARALMTEPDFVVADEPTSALDVSVQSSVLNLLMELQEEYNLTIVFIAHDLSVINHICDRVAVMYLGEIVEIADTEDIFQNPQHPYTRSLLSAVPVPNPHVEHNPIVLEDTVPSPSDKPSGCPFHTRCPANIEGVCKTEVPPLEQVSEGSNQYAACHLKNDEEAMRPIRERTRSGIGQQEKEASD